MKRKALHLIAFDIPYPADYGGVIDIFYKLKALHDNGAKVTLHCYHYGREISPILEKYAAKVYYYARKTFKNPFYGQMPYIVNSRNSTDLLDNLMRDDAPILFEGLHTTYSLTDEALNNRYKVVRAHNVEHEYYHRLEMVERNYFKKYFFRVESEKLARYERVLRHANAVAAISPADVQHFQRKYRNAFYLPAFHPNEEIKVSLGRGKYALYHGNLGVGENNEAALYLVNEVFNKLDIPLVIAGNNPSRQLQRSVEDLKNVEIREGVSTTEILNLVHKAHINVLPTFQATGIKLKLINALFLGRHCLVNGPMVNNTGLEPLCHMGDTPEQMVRLLNELWKQSFEESDVEERESILRSGFNNGENARKFLERLED